MNKNLLTIAIVLVVLVACIPFASAATLSQRTSFDQPFSIVKEAQIKLTSILTGLTSQTDDTDMKTTTDAINTVFIVPEQGGLTSFQTDELQTDKLQTDKLQTDDRDMKIGLTPKTLYSEVYTDTPTKPPETRYEFYSGMMYYETRKISGYHANGGGALACYDIITVTNWDAVPAKINIYEIESQGAKNVVMIDQTYMVGAKGVASYDNGPKHINDGTNDGQGSYEQGRVIADPRFVKITSSSKYVAPTIELYCVNAYLWGNQEGGYELTVNYLPGDFRLVEVG